MSLRLQHTQVDAGTAELKQELSRALQRNLQAEQELAVLREKNTRLTSPFRLDTGGDERRPVGHGGERRQSNQAV